MPELQHAGPEIVSQRTPEEIRALHRQTCTVREACERAQVSPRTIYNWIARGKVRYVRTAGGAMRIFTESLFKPGKHD